MGKDSGHLLTASETVSVEAAGHILGVKSQHFEACGVAFAVGIREGALGSPALSPSFSCAVSVDPSVDTSPRELAAETLARGSLQGQRGSGLHCRPRRLAAPGTWCFSPALSPPSLLFVPLQPDCRRRKSELSAHTGVPRSRGTWKETWDLFSNRFYDSKKASSSSNSGGKSVREVGTTCTSGPRPALNTAHLPSWVVLASSVDTPSSVRNACCLAHRPATSEPLGGMRGNGF